MSDTDATRKRHHVADLLREYAAWLYDRRTIDEEESMTLHGIADQIDREHERRMEQCRYETRRSFAKYLRQITAEYEIGRKRKSWLRQMKMQLELEALRLKAAEDGGAK